MAAVNNNYQSSEKFRNREKKDDEHNINIAGGQNFEEDIHHHLHRGLKARQITMIAIGGAIGTGLIIGTSVCPHLGS
jgi:yeast amino acid transporter